MRPADANTGPTIDLMPWNVKKIDVYDGVIVAIKIVRSRFPNWRYNG